MKLWLISQDQCDGYDTYDSAVVAAETEAEARRVVPGGYYEYDDKGILVNGLGREARYPSWATDAEAVKVKYIGEAKDGTEPGEICASFNSG